MTKIALYSKPLCALCDDARRAIERLSSRYLFEWEEVDVYRDPERWRAMRYELPVVEVNGQRVASLHVEEAQLEAALKAAGTSVAQPPPRSA